MQASRADVPSRVEQPSPGAPPAGIPVPEPVRRILTREAAGEEAFGQVYVLTTVDPAGYPHVALLTGDQVRVGPRDDELHAVVWGSRTRAHLIGTGRATLLVAEGRFAHYLKLTVVDSVEKEGRLGVVLRLTDCAHDTAGVDLVPMAFRWSAQLAAREAWERDAAVLDSLAQRRPPHHNRHESGP